MLNKLLMSLKEEVYSLWKDEELKDIGITYHNVCEICKQLQVIDEKDKGLEDISVDPVLEEPEPET